LLARRLCHQLCVWLLQQFKVLRYLLALRLLLLLNYGARVLLAELDDRMELVKPNGELTTPPAADASTGKEEG
jgi:hypothetical protein